MGSRRIVLTLGVVLLLLCCASCASRPATFDAKITRPDGKVVYDVHGTMNDNRSWAEKNLGPIGGLLGELLVAMGKVLLLPIPTP